MPPQLQAAIRNCQCIYIIEQRLRHFSLVIARREAGNCDRLNSVIAAAAGANSRCRYLAFIAPLVLRRRSKDIVATPASTRELIDRISDRLDIDRLS
jgi:hypothetical protein